MAVLIPTNSPAVFTNAPPLFPGFTAASVWINASIPIFWLRGLSALMLRALALTIPAVTVDVNPNGFPTANTHSPTFKLSESPNLTMGRSLASIFINAKSVEGSVPITRPLKVLLSFRVISNLSAPSTT